MGFPGSVTAAERAALRAAESDGSSFLAYRDEFNDLRIVALTGDRVTIGRGEGNDITLSGQEVSRHHAQIEPRGAGWGIVDDQMSRNGTFINGDRVGRFRRLEDHDVIRIGASSIVFRQPHVVGGQTTAVTPATHRPSVTPAELRVLTELCRPLLATGGLALPATNPDIASDLVMSVAGVKSHIRSLFAKFDIGDMPQNRKRAELAHRALQLGIVTEVTREP